MSRFYFDVWEGTCFTSDEVGVELDSLDAAEYEAACGAAEIGRDQLPKGHARDITIEVRDEHGQQVVTVRVSMEVCRGAPAPAREACVGADRTA